MNEESFDADQFVSDYLALIDSYRALPSHPQVIIWGRLAPIFEGHRFYGHPRLDSIQAALERVVSAADVAAIDIATPLADQADHFPDRIHPDDVAAGIIADTVYQALSTIGLPTPAPQDLQLKVTTGLEIAR